LVFGIVDFGHAWYMKQEITTASREGARYGTRYQTNAGGVHLLPNALSPSISSWVTSKYAPLLPSDANLTVTPSGPGYTSGAAGDDLLVTCTARKNWFVLGHLIPGFGSFKDLSATTVMKCE
jgi:Flp pilus assembly protein TadG